MSKPKRLRTLPPIPSPPRDGNWQLVNGQLVDVDQVKPAAEAAPQPSAPSIKTGGDKSTDADQPNPGQRRNRNTRY